MLQKILTWSFYILLAITPLIFTPFNNELFEYNKMMFVYLLTIVTTTTWLLKIINQKSLIFNRTPLDIPILFFLVSQILSTIFSIDQHTSIFGYYSRSNGGLLSIISYILLYYCLVSNFKALDAIKFLKAAIFGGVVVSLWAIPEHFGFSPSCLILTGNGAATCWVQDVQARVFATLGQPNWMAAYIAMLIFPTLYFALTVKNRFEQTAYLLILIALYLSFTFTYSRGATLGLIAGGLIFVVLFVFCHPERMRRISELVSAKHTHIHGRFFSFDKLRIRMTDYKQNFKLIISILLILITINLFFGSALGRFNLFSSTPQPQASKTPSGTTQLESGGTESGQIRLIVWQGALEIFKHYPILGSGVETFAYSYYNYRPASHNLVSEWDFLYNKAHNEYLNYLATTGLVGFLSYIAIIFTFIFWNIKKLIFSTKQKKIDSNNFILVASLLASYTSYLVQNFFGFSVVIIALFFFLFPAFSFLVTEDTKQLKIPKHLHLLSSLSKSIYKRQFYLKFLNILILLLAFYLIITLSRMWIADTLYKRGSDFADLGNPGRSYNYLLSATSLNDLEPLYKSELGFAAASATSVLQEQDATTSARLIEEAINQDSKALEISPKNISLLRTSIRTYYQLSSIDKSFEQKTIDVIDKTISLAPTDAKLYYNKALILWQIDKKDEAISTMEKTIKLKPNYHEALFTLGLFYEEVGKKDKAIELMDTILKLIPNEPAALKKLEELKETK